MSTKRKISSVLEGPQDAKIRSPKDQASIYTAKDDRLYIVCILEGHKKDGVIYQEDSCAVFGTEEFLKAIEVGDQLNVED